MRRAFLRASVSCCFVLASVSACHGDDPSLPTPSVQGFEAPLEVSSTPRGGELLRHTRRRFSDAKVPFLAKPGVEGYRRVGDTFYAVTYGPKGKAPIATVELPPFADGAARVASGNVQVSVRPKVAHAAIEWAQDFAIHPEVEPGVTMFRRVDAEGLDDVFEVSSPRDTLSFEYQVSLRGAGGLRLVENTLEVLDRDGAPRVRMPAPIVADAHGVHRVGRIEVRGCAVDRDPRGPWGRPLVPAGKDECEVVASVDGRGLSYPVLVDPAWVGTASSKRSHGYHKLLKLSAGSDAGKILLVGGTGSGPTDTELFDPTTSTWAVSSALPDSLGKGTNAVVLPSGVVMIAGGFPTGTGTTAKSNTYVRSTTTGTWSSAATMGSARAWFTMVPTKIDAKDVIFVAGGMPSTSISTKPLKTAEYYEPISDSWFTATSMTAERSHAGYDVLSDGRILVVGGHGFDSFGSTQLKTVEIYNPSTKTWAAGAALNTERSDGAVLALAGGKAIVTGGWNETDYTIGGVEYFDGTAWTSILGKGLTEPRMFHVASQLTDGRILVAGGNVEYDDPKYAMTATATADLISLGTDPKTTATLASTGSMAVARIAPAAIALGQNVLVNGGQTTDVDGSETTSTELFDTTIGAACSTSSPCPTGLSCTEGVCCKSSSCPEGQTCAAPGFEGICTKPKGASCTSNTECGTGFCVTGVCCATACTGDCETCNVKGKEGTCTAAAVGTDPKGKCAGDPSCGPFCDSTGDCYEYAPTGTKCGASLGDAGSGSFCTSYACDDWSDCVKTTFNCGLTCTTSVTCDEATKTCSASASGIKAGQCVIDGQCWSYGDINPKDACQLCDPPSSKTAWSTAASCIDGGVEDTGTVEEDTGTTPVEDTGSPATDTGTPIPAEDATSPVDTGTSSAAPLPEASACGCELPGRTGTTAPFGALGLGLALVLARRRRS